MFNLHGRGMTTINAGNPDRPRLTVISASVRHDRIGPAVARWVTARAHHNGHAVTTIDLADVALPDDRLLAPGGGPTSEISDVVDASDGFVIVTPEYNHSYPASLKRAIDWHYTEWKFKAATVVSYGARGGWLATEHLRGVFAELNVVTTRNVVGVQAPWAYLDGGAFGSTEALDSAVDGAIAELSWWSDLLRDARQSRPFAS